MPTDLYLTRKTNGTWVKFSDVISTPEVTSNSTLYSGVTGDAGTDIVTVPGSTPIAGMPFVFTALTGGTGITLNRRYYMLTPTGTTFQFSETQGGAAVNFTTNITAGSVMFMLEELPIWSPSYRDQFQSTMRQVPTGGNAPSGEINVPAVIDELSVTTGTGTSATTPTYGEKSDEVTHAPLRQTLLQVTHWKFTLAGPLYLFAVWQDGDIISNNPPEIP